MATYFKLLVILALFSIANARPATQFVSDSSSAGAALANIESSVDDNPDLYLIIAEAVDEDKSSQLALDDTENDEDLEKRSAEEADDDLETAAGTNVLRPLFVYRQQVAYRERVKKGARRFGIRPRF